MQHIVKYFEKLTGLIPTEYQKEFLHHAIQIQPSGNKKYNKIIISAGRQSGKTLCCAVVALWFVFEYEKPVKIVLCSAQDNILYFHMREIFKKHPELVERLSEQSKLAANLIPMKGFETNEGSIVFVKKSTEKQVLGTPADIVIIDEACRVDDEIIKVLFGNITGNISKIIMLSTPDIDNSFMVRTMNAKDKDWRIFIWSAENLEWHNEEIEKEKRKQYTPAEYATQVLGRPKEPAERTFFPQKHLNDCTMEISNEREGGSKSYLEAGIDVGEVSGTYLIITERIGTMKRKIIYFICWKGELIEIAPEVAKILNIYKPQVTKCDNRPAQFRGMIEKYTNIHINYIDGEKIDLIDSTGKPITHKSHMLGQLLSKIRNHNLIIPYPYAQDIVEQIKVYRRGMQTGDDWVDALALSCYEPSTPLESGHNIFVFGGNKKEQKYQYGRPLFKESKWKGY